MYLKRLELQGFKSFPEKVRLDFNTGITAVVGPNGSGKSNVSDAVRWVLGEQRAKNLRGDKMEDVIFAGTENRKPQGFAEATIIMDNQDGALPIAFTEVQVTRRVFRSGESEYRINGTACRLKDIQELFMDTGVGREGYSIIGQGRIDAILSAKGEERRHIFEEATGIVKYKTRRNEAVTKLDKEQQNLLRAEDIILELEGQLKPLEEQSKKARQYLSLSQQLKEGEIAMFCTDTERMEAEEKKLGDKKDTAITQKIKMQQTLAKDKAETETLHLQLSSQNQVLQQINDDIARVKGAIEKKDGEIRLTAEQMQHDTENISRMKKEMEEKKKKQLELKGEQEVCRSRITALDITAEQEKNKLAALEEGCKVLDIALRQKETETEDVKDEIFEHIRTGTEAKGEISKQEAIMEQFLARKEQLDMEIAHGESRLEQQRTHGQVLEKKGQEQKQQAAFLEKELFALEQDDAQSTKMKLAVQKDLAEQERRLTAKQSRLALLSEMEREHEGFFHSVKRLLQLPDKEKRGICGAVGELLQVEEQYEAAVEAALGSAMQNIITKTEEDAKDAIQYLKEHRLGRATFLPISAVKGRQWEGNAVIFAERGVLGKASDLVQYEAIYAEIMTYLLGRILVVETLEDGVRLAKKYQHRYRMVTLEGDIMNPGGAMTGGSQMKKSTNIFGRSREIGKLRQELDEIQGKTEELREKLQLAEEDAEEISRQIVEKKLELQQRNVAQQSNQEERKKNQAEQKEAQEKIRLLQLEESQLLVQLERAEQDIAAEKLRLTQSEQAVAGANAALSAFQEHLAADKEQREQLMEEMTRHRIALSENSQNIAAAEENLRRFQKEYEETENHVKLLQMQMIAFKENGGTRNKKQADLQQEQADLRKKERELYAHLEETKTELAALSEKISAKEEDAGNLAEAISLLEQDIFRMETRLDNMRQEKQRVFDHIWEEYELTYQGAKTFVAGEKRSYEELSRLTKQWKGEIRGLGYVNVAAVDQYQEVLERYTFLTDQKKDILEAEEKLKGLIQDLSIRMEKQFQEQFAVISKNFSMVFQEMFGGGKAYLKLQDDSKALESAIEIVAQPPGKSLQNMQLLSGGERALTAIAILFSILKMKPSPFCILDEIEAALDDANVKRYAQYLTRFSGETQFIVITHRKGTMEYADILYGVTMQEKGVSKLISVDFSERKK